MSDHLPSWTPSVHHDGSGRYVRKQTSAPHGTPGVLEFRLRHAITAPVVRIFLRFTPEGEQRFLEMHPAPDTNTCRWWSCTAPLNMPVLKYRFLLLTDDGWWWYTANGVQRGMPTDAADFRIVWEDETPSWIPGAVFYQIAPDRFHNGDPSISVRTGEYMYRGRQSVQRSWGEKPATDWDHAHVEFFGGDLAGISEKIPYLLDLGVNALYLLPIFTAPSNHKYDVTDYEQIDPHLGGNAALVRLREATQRHDLRLVLDIVPNHCGWEHPWFIEASRDRSSPFAEFFAFTKHPEEYDSWLGHRSLPRLNYTSGRLREYMISGPDAICRRWLRPPYSVDGWRVDVANMLGRQGGQDLSLEMARAIRKAVKTETPEAYLLAEHFFDASEVLQGDAWDASMNYAGFTLPLWAWLTRQRIRQHWEPFEIPAGSPLSTPALLDSWAAFRSSLPWAVVMRQLNLLGSHDTPRLLTTLNGDLSLQQVAVGLLMTYPGVPCVLYGDEIGMEGKDTQVLQCMPWDERSWQAGIRRFYRQLIHFRRRSHALSAGGFQVLDQGRDWFAFQRDTDTELIVVVANRGIEGPGRVRLESGGIPDGVIFRDILRGNEMRLTGGYITIPDRGPGVSVLQAGVPA